MFVCSTSLYKDQHLWYFSMNFAAIEWKTLAVISPTLLAKLAPEFFDLSAAHQLIRPIYRPVHWPISYRSCGRQWVSGSMEERWSTGVNNWLQKQWQKSWIVYCVMNVGWLYLGICTAFLWFKGGIYFSVLYHGMRWSNWKLSKYCLNQNQGSGNISHGKIVNHSFLRSLPHPT